LKSSYYRQAVKNVEAALLPQSEQPSLLDAVSDEAGSMDEVEEVA
jgi:hypothetical protein